MVKVDQQGDSKLYLETNILEKYLVVVEIFDYKVGGMLKKTPVFMYFDAQLFLN